jgi:hypothetical protein
MPLLVLAALSIAPSCGTAVSSIRSTAPTPAEIAELWNEPEPNRDLLWGIGGQALAPNPAATYTVLDVKHGGFSRGLTVHDPDKRKWSAKFPPEAPTEVVASRILWAVGYHQPPVYYLGKWNAVGAPDPNPQLPARFREVKPAFHGLDAKGHWSYYRNPFVGTPELNGLLVLQAMLGNSDLKDEQNDLYEFTEPVEGARRWYVARDLGKGTRARYSHWRSRRTGSGCSRAAAVSARCRARTATRRRARTRRHRDRRTIAYVCGTWRRPSSCAASTGIRTLS